MEAKVVFNLIMRVTSHHFYSIILFVRNKSVQPIPLVRTSTKARRQGSSGAVWEAICHNKKKQIVFCLANNCTPNPFSKIACSLK